ncbi:MAG TPA: DUF1700 domain-containing protein [Virgibacillus sp.]|nr:DUF1700 domain-containing protein [Virgibacillus sp.]
MNRKEFLMTLEKSLNNISKEERQDILHDFEEHFALGIEDGKSEEEIVKALGSPHRISKELLASYHIEKVETTASAGNMFRAVWAVIGLGFFNLVIVLGPFLALAGVILGGWIISIVFVASPIIVILNALIHPSTVEAFEIFVSLILCGIGLFVGIGMNYATKWLSRGFVRYLAYNASIVKGGLVNG